MQALLDRWAAGAVDPPTMMLGLNYCERRETNERTQAMTHRTPSLSPRVALGVAAAVQWSGMMRDARRHDIMRDSHSILALRGSRQAVSHTGGIFPAQTCQRGQTK